MFLPHARSILIVLIFLLYDTYFALFLFCNVIWFLLDCVRGALRIQYVRRLHLSKSPSLQHSRLAMDLLRVRTADTKRTKRTE